MAAKLKDWERRQRANLLQVQANQIAALFDFVNPEDIQLDIERNQVCLPAFVAQKLVEKASA